MLRRVLVLRAVLRALFAAVRFDPFVYALSGLLADDTIALLDLTDQLVPAAAYCL